MPGLLTNLFGSVFEGSVALINIALILLTIYIFGDAIKSSIDYLIPNKDKKIWIKYVVGIVLIVISIIFNAIFLS